MQFNASSQESPPQSEYNSNLVVIIRLHELTKYFSLARLNEDWYSYYKGLLGFWLELSSEINDTTNTKIRKDIKSINKLINASFQKQPNGKSRFQPVTNLIENLISFEQALRKLQKDKGLGTTEKSDPGRAILSGR